MFSITRGYNFWSTKVCEGGESREAYACRLIFDPPEFLFEINNQVTQFVRKPTFIRLQTDQILTFDPVRTNEGGSKVGFRTVYQSRDYELSENSLLIHLHSFELYQKWVFDQFVSESKVGFRTNWVTWSLLSRKFRWIKIESACICFTWLTSFTYLSGSKVGPSRSILNF